VRTKVLTFMLLVAMDNANRDRVNAWLDAAKVAKDALNGAAYQVVP
jgi:hypothetical protein